MIKKRSNPKKDGGARKTHAIAKKKHGDNNDDDNAEDANERGAATHPRMMRLKKDDSVATPDSLFDQLDAYFGGFTYDPCPLHGLGDSAVPNGLETAWGRTVFCNPPYSDIAPWLFKACLELVEYGTRCVFLMPAHIECHYWDDYVYPYASEIWVCTSGIVFPGFRCKLPMPMSIVLYGDFPQKDRTHNTPLVLGRYVFRLLFLQQRIR